MNNFYKGGRELAYLREILQSIHSIKNRCLVWFTTSYRSIDAKASECNIALEHTAFFVGQHAKLLTNFAPTSNFLRVGFEPASNFFRVKQYENSKPTRIKLDKKPKYGRISSEESGNKVGCRTGVIEDRLFSNSGQLRTVFVPASKYLRPAKYLLITFQLPFLGQPMFGRCVRGVQGMGEVRSRLEESTNPVPRMYCLSTVSSRGRYRKGTRSVLRSYWRGTKEVLRSYWKGTGISMTDVTSGREVGNLNLEVDSVVERTAKARLTTNQACVERMLSVCQAWIVCKTVPVYALSTHYVRLGLASSMLNPYLANALSQIRAFKPFNFFSQVFTHVECDNSLSRLKHVLWRINRSIRDINSEVLVYKVLDTVKVILAPVLAIFQYLYFSSHALKSTRMLLTCIAVFYMFSLSAQTPRQDSGADGQMSKKIERQNIPYFVEIIDRRENPEEQLMYYPDADLEKYPVFQYHAKKDRIIPLKAGKNIPDEIWDLPIRIVNDIEGRDSITLRELAGDKILVLDFWAKWCSPCLKSMDKWKVLQPKYSEQVQVVGLMLDWDYRAELMIRKMGWNMPQLIGPEVYLLNYYFCGTPVTGPSAWINKNRFIGLADTRADSEKIINDLSSGLPPSLSENADPKQKKRKEKL